MTSPTSFSSPTARTIVVAALALAMLAIDSTDVKRLWQPVGIFGYGTNLDGVVTGVDPGSPAEKAGIRVGDRLDTAAMTVQQRWDLIQIAAVESAGLSRTFGVFHGAQRRTVTLVSAPEPMGAPEQSVVILGLLAAVIFIVVGAGVVLLRPDPATWGFFLYCIGYGPQQTAAFDQMLRAPWIVYEQYGLAALLAAGSAGIIVFSLRFLQDAVRGWRGWAALATPFIALGVFLSAAAQTAYTYVAGLPAEWLTRPTVAFESAVAAIVVVALVDTFIHRSGGERQRIRWVVFGFAVALLSSLAVNIVQTEATNTPIALVTAIGLLAAIAPVAVAYAVVKHRVIDVNFVVSRTLVYGVLTTIFIAVFAFIDWFVGRVLDQTRWALVAEIGVAIGVGFWLNGLHARVDRFVDAVLFRRRHAAERRLARLVRGLPHATSPAFVDASLIDEPHDALDLTSAALFRRDAPGRYRRMASFEWADGTATSLAEGDPLILHLQAERGAIRLSELHWACEDAPEGPGRPALALPIVVRHELEAIVLYGAHRGGEDFDPDELQWLNSLAVAAGAAYDHLEADALRKQLDLITRENENQRIMLQQNGLLPA